MHNNFIGCPYMHQLTLNGKGKVRANPDIAIMNIGIITEDKELEKAQQQNAATTSAVIHSLKAAGIKDTDIQTINYSVNPEYDYVEGRQVFRAYRVINTLRVTIRAIDRAGAIIDRAARNGANEIGNIQFTVSDSSMYYNQALNLAIKDAIGKATEIEKTFGYNINKTPISITEETVSFTPKMDFAMMRSEDATPIQPGELEITASVKVVFGYN